MKTSSTFLKSMRHSLLGLALLSAGTTSAQINISKPSVINPITPDNLQTIQQFQDQQARFNPNFKPTARSSRPTLVVLIHGGTSDPASSPSPFEPPSPSGAPSTRPGNLGYSRFYWDFPFVRQAVGATGDLFTLGGGSASRLSATTWKSSLTNNLIDNQFAFPTDPLPLAGRFSGTAAALVRANGSIALGDMAKQVLDEVRRLRNRFETYAGREPYVVLVGHSKGGLVIRYLMCVPTGTVAQHDLSDADEAFLRELRNDTRFVATVSSPHTGSPLADYGQDLREDVGAVQDVIDDIWGVIRGAASLVRINLPASSPLDITFAEKMISSSDPDLGHLTTEFWNDMNNGPLHPRNMVRSDNTLIPAYLYGGRAAGDNFYSIARFDGADTASFVSQMASSNQATAINAKAAMGLMGLDWALHNVVNGDWGRIRSAGAGKNLDMVRRAYPKYSLFGNSMSNPGERIPILNQEGNPTYYLRNQADRETDNDGMVGIDSALGIGLFTGPVAIEAMQVIGAPVPATIMEPFDHTQNVAPAGSPVRRGSFYRMYSGAWNFTNHFTEIKRPELGTEINRLVRSAGPLTATGALSIWPAQ